jgi:predicted 3-demethylubiquinone-9 3-methyltransferase (glyoxalase superfamily)
MPSITPFLWFDTQAEEAMNFYVSVFPRSRVIRVSKVQGRVMSVVFEVNGQRLMALNGGPVFTFNEAVSLFVGCETQAEIDTLWEKLTVDGGQAGQCGWLKDRFGLSWQIVPTSLQDLLGGPDPAAGGRVMQAMMKMGKIEVAELEAALNAG